MRTPSQSLAATVRRIPRRYVTTLVVLAVLAFPALAFSADTVVATIPVGDSPEAVAVDPVTHNVYVANFYGDSVTVIDGVADVSEATVPMPTGGSLAAPIAIVADPLTGKAYVGNWWSNYVSVIGPGMDVVATITPPASHAAGVRALALDPSGTTPKVYAAIMGKATVSVIDASTDTIVKNIPVGDTPRALAAFASGARHRVYAANRYSNDVSIIDGVTDSVVATVSTGAGPKAIAVDSARGFAYVTSPASDTVTVIGDDDAKAATIGVGDNPVGIASDPVRRRVFVADYLQAAVTVIDADTLSVVGTVTTGAQPYAVAVDQSAGKVFVTCYGGSSVSVIDPLTLSSVTVPVGSYPYALGIDEGLAVHKTFVGNWDSNDVSVIDPAVGAGGLVTVTVDPLAGGATNETAPVFTGTAVSVRAPQPSAVVAVFFRVDGDPAWHRAVITDGAGTPSVRWSASLGTLATAPHTLCVAAMDQALAVASSSDQGSGGASAALGTPAAYGFSVVDRGPAVPPVTSAEVSPASPDGDGGWYRTQPVVTLTADQPVPTHYVWDGGSVMATYTAALDAPVGAHSLTYLSGSDAVGYESPHSLALAYDPVPPMGPSLADITHTPGVWSSSAEVVVGLGAATDAESGVGGYAAAWSSSPDAVPGAFGLDPLASSVATSLADGAWYVAVQARDVAGNTGEVVRAGPYVIDTTPPVTRSDAVARYTDTARIALSAEDAGSGLGWTAYRLDGGAWAEGSLVVAGPGSHTLEFRSTDAVGNEEAVVTVRFDVVARYEETDRRIVRYGKWSSFSDPRLSGGSAITTARKGAFVRVTFSGTSLAWIAPKGKGYGLARVMLDDRPPVTVDLSSGTSLYRVAAWQCSGLAPGEHTVLVEYTGAGGAFGKGTAVAIDAFDIVGTPLTP